MISLEEEGVEVVNPPQEEDITTTI